MACSPLTRTRAAYFVSAVGRFVRPALTKVEISHILSLERRKREDEDGEKQRK